MRTYRQVKAITSQMEVLEELRVQLENIETHIDEVMKKGKSWIEEEENQSYAEINQLLSNETVDCLKRCSMIADGNEEILTCSPTKKGENISTESQSSASLPYINFKDDSDYQSLMERLDSVEKSVSSLNESSKIMEENYSRMSQYYEKNSSMANNSEPVDILFQKFADQEKHSKKIWKRIAKLNGKNELKLEELAAQTQAAIDFMTNLKKQMETLMAQTDLNLQQKHTELEEKFRTILTRQISAEDKFCLKIDEIISEISRVNDSVNKIRSQQESLCKENNDNQKRFNEICVFVDIVKSLHQSVIDQEDGDNRCQICQEKIEESNIKTLEQMQNLYQTTDVSLQILHSSFTDFSVQFDCFRDDVSFNIDTIKKNFLDTSVTLSTLKSTTDCFIASQTQKSENVEKKITTISSQVDGISQDIKIRDIAEVFCAQIDRNMRGKEVHKDQVFPFFNNVINIRDSSPNYNTHTGIYTVPYDGLYLVGLMVESSNDVKVSFNVYTKNKAGDEILTAFIHSYKRDIVGSVLMPTNMYKGELLYVKPKGNYSGISLGATSFFMCILMNKT